MRISYIINVVLLVLLVTVSAGVGAHAQEVYTRKGIALDGYDVVAYHLEEEAIRGTRLHSAKWNDVIWFFSSDRNLRLFVSDPEKYAPQYGGYCAYAVANNAVAPIDPEAFDIVDEKLYLNFSRSVQRRWSLRRNRYISVADANWPNLLHELRDKE